MAITREEQKRNTNEKIRSVSKKLIIQKGIHNTTVREISKVAKVATGTVLSHYSSKNDLFYNIFYEDINGFAEKALKSVKRFKTLETKLIHICNSFLQSYASEPRLYTDFLEISMYARGSWGERFTKQVEEFGVEVAKIYIEAVKNKEIKEDVDIQAAVGTFFSFYFMGIMTQIKMNFSDPDTSLRQFTALIRLHLKGIQK